MIRRALTKVRGVVRFWAVVWVLAPIAGGTAASADEHRLRCFGNEPSWGLALESPGRAELTLLDGTTRAYAGTGTLVEARPERVWRGRPDDGGADLVAFLRETGCSDGMSNVTHPFEVRVSVDAERVLAGCCRTVADTAAAAPPVGTIEGRDWRLTRVGGVDAQALTALREPSGMRLQQGQVQAFGGCNRLAGGYSVDRDRITVGTLAATMMTCGDDVMVIERAFARALEGASNFRIEDGRLTLQRDGESEPVLEFAAAAPPQLEGIDWEVTGYNNGRSAVVSPQLGTTLTVRFEDGTLAGDAGCNRFHGTYARDGAGLRVDSALATTRKHCPDDVMQQEREFLAAVQSAVTWAIDRGMLDMHRADGERVLTASRASDP
jgi:heat shock protein HslJ